MITRANNRADFSSSRRCWGTGREILPTDKTAVISPRKGITFYIPSAMTGLAQELRSASIAEHL